MNPDGSLDFTNSINEHSKFDDETQNNINSYYGYELSGSMGTNEIGTRSETRKPFYSQNTRTNFVHIPIPVIRTVEVRVPQPYPIPMIRTVKIPVPHPFPVTVTKPFLFQIPKVIPVPIKTPLYIPVPKPYAVRIPVPVQVQFPIQVSTHTDDHSYRNGFTKSEQLNTGVERFNGGHELGRGRSYKQNYGWMKF